MCSIRWTLGVLAISCGIAAGQATAQVTRFAVIGDFGSNTLDKIAVADLIARWEVDFVITTGDNRYGVHPYDAIVGRSYCAFLKDVESGPFCDGGMAPVNAFFPTIGNHEYTDPNGIGDYLAYFTLPGTDFPPSSGTESYYDFVRGPVHFFALDSNVQAPDGSTATSDQARWLQVELAASTAAWQIVYFHHPPYASGSLHGSHRRMRWPFAEWGADAVLSGNDHTYERVFRDGIVYFVSGLGGQSRHGFDPPVGGSRVRYNEGFGALIVEATPNTMTFRFVALEDTERFVDTYVLPDPDHHPFAAEEGWRLIGLPLDAPDASPTGLFGRTAAPEAYWFDPVHGYTAVETLEPGRGYWVLFQEADAFGVAGSVRAQVDVAVEAGWNLVAGPGCAVPVADVTTDPPGLVASSFHGHDAGGYFAERAALSPWAGYWVLLDGPGTLTMTCP